MNAASGPSLSVQSSQRSGWLVSAILVAGSPACIGQLGGTGGCSPTAAQVATATTAPPAKQTNPEKSAPRSVPTSCTTARNSSPGGTSVATSVATRRNAACSAASTCSSARL